jgi:hypothetical protein
LPLEALRWLVLVVVSYAAITLLRAGWRRQPSAEVDARRAETVSSPPR